MFYDDEAVVGFAAALIRGDSDFFEGGCLEEQFVEEFFGDFVGEVAAPYCSGFVVHGGGLEGFLATWGPLVTEL